MQKKQWIIFWSHSKKIIKIIKFSQVDKGIVCINIVSTFHIIITIHQSFNVKVFWKFEQLANLEHTFHVHFFNIETPQTLSSTYNKLNEILNDFKMQLK